MCAWKVPEMQLAVPNRRSFLITPAILFYFNHALQAERISDDDFISLVEKFSDSPSGPASADNFVTNEDSIASAVDQVAAEVPRGTVYLGVGPDQNFTLMAHARPSAGFIIDYRRKNQLLHFMHQYLLQSCGSRLEYLRKFWARVPKELKDTGSSQSIVHIIAAFEKTEMNQMQLKRFQDELIQHVAGKYHLGMDDQAELVKIAARLAGPGPDARFLALRMYPTMKMLMQQTSRSGKPGHWLASDALYEEIRQMAIDNKILPLSGDWSAGSMVASGSVFSRLAGYLRQKQQQVGCMYISDVEFFLFRSGKFDEYVANLKRLPMHPEARIVRTSTREIRHPERMAGNSSTTICRPMRAFLEACHLGKIRRWEDLF
jgi:hypothetical protein